MTPRRQTARCRCARLAALAWPLLLLGLAGCSMLPGSGSIGGKPDREFMQRVAEDPFPTAAQKGIGR